MGQQHDQSTIPSRVFTPVHRTSGERIEIPVDSSTVIPRGRRWKRIIRNVVTGRRYQAWSKSCGLPRCMCDAYVVGLPDERVSTERQWRDAWCQCVESDANTIRFLEGKCPCGIRKHHDHCSKCQGVEQLG